jgi:hypothetical protein
MSTFTTIKQTEISHMSLPASAAGSCPVIVVTSADSVNADSAVVVPLEVVYGPITAIGGKGTSPGSSTVSVAPATGSPSVPVSPLVLASPSFSLVPKFHLGTQVPAKLRFARALVDPPGVGTSVLVIPAQAGIQKFWLSLRNPGSPPARGRRRGGWRRCIFTKKALVVANMVSLFWRF